MQLQLLLSAALCLTLIIIGAKVQIPLPYFDYYTLQFTFVLLTAALLPMRYAISVMGSYILLGLIGVPVFAAGGGLGYVLRPSFGYLIGFLATIACISGLYRAYPVTSRFHFFLLNFLGIIITYIFGLGYKGLIINLYMNQILPVWTIMTSAFAFDIPADVIMICLLSLVEPRIVKAITHSTHSWQVKESNYCD